MGGALFWGGALFSLLLGGALLQLKVAAGGRSLACDAFSKRVPRRRGVVSPVFCRKTTLFYHRGLSLMRAPLLTECLFWGSSWRPEGPSGGPVILARRLLLTGWLLCGSPHFFKGPHGAALVAPPFGLRESSTVASRRGPQRGFLCWRPGDPGAGLWISQGSEGVSNPGFLMASWVLPGPK